MTLRFAWVLVTASLQFASGTVQRFSVFSDPIFLRPSEVHNRYVLPKALPEQIVKQFANQTMHVKSLQLDILLVNNTTGEKTPAPLYKTYNHHHGLMLGSHDDLMQMYKYAQGKDPFDPSLYPNQTDAFQVRELAHAQAHAHASVHGACMMKRRSFESLINSALPQAKRSSVTVFGGASGAEYRGTSSKLAGPYTYGVDSPEGFMALIHFINTHGAPESKKLWECPCTTDRNINISNGTIDGKVPVAFDCSEQLLQERNTACSLATYQGGYRCCEHGVFLTEAPHPRGPIQQIEAKFTFEFYAPDAPEVKSARRTMQPSCCDATQPKLEERSIFTGGNVEYDVPQCAPGTPPEQCEHVLSNIEFFDVSGDNASDSEEEFELVHAWGHQHVGGNGLELYKESTGELLCRTHPKYGAGKEAGDERGFVVGIPPCVWGPPPLKPPPRLRRSDHMRTVARYNSTQSHHGVMSLWFLTATPVKSQGAREEYLI
ncbi:unnamed protein product [Effrenium voratum]|nr:unnamed protein product [Effrenium voratum]|mmetsp:Transcript_28138/g.66847  ORF Transcript_28138/g.66847 Transcript_28138/m.66847 type:complete len:488 (-) Transcript_28138:96-1559(-)